MYEVPSTNYYLINLYKNSRMQLFHKLYTNSIYVHLYN